MELKDENALKALEFVIPVLEKLGLRWCITGGFACYAYGVDRPITDIDIDVEGSKEDESFKRLYEELAPKLTQPWERLLDQNYDNFNFEVTVDDVVVDICPMKEMNVMNKATKLYENFYPDGFARVEMVDFHGLSLPLLAKDLIIKNKEMLVWQRDSDLRDIAGLKRLLAK